MILTESTRLPLVDRAVRSSFPESINAPHEGRHGVCQPHASLSPKANIFRRPGGSQARFRAVDSALLDRGDGLFAADVDVDANGVEDVGRAPFLSRPFGPLDASAGQGGDALQEGAGSRSREGHVEINSPRSGSSQQIEAFNGKHMNWTEMPDSAMAFAEWLQLGLIQQAEQIWQQIAGPGRPVVIPTLGMQRARLREAGLTLGLDRVRAALLVAELKAVDKGCLGLSLALLPLLLLQSMRPTYPSKLAIHVAWTHVLARTQDQTRRGT